MGWKAPKIARAVAIPKGHSADSVSTSSCKTDSSEDTTILVSTTSHMRSWTLLHALLRQLIAFVWSRSVPPAVIQRTKYFNMRQRLKRLKQRGYPFLSPNFSLRKSKSFESWTAVRCWPFDISTFRMTAFLPPNADTPPTRMGFRENGINGESERTSRDLRLWKLPALKGDFVAGFLSVTSIVRWLRFEAQATLTLLAALPTCSECSIGRTLK